MTRTARPGLDQRGFTLAELLVCVAVVGLVMGGVLILLMTGSTAYLTGTSQVEAQNNARTALERMVQEIRGAGYNPQAVSTFNPVIGSGACPNATGPTASGFMLVSDSSADGVIQATECTLYRLNGNNLERQQFGVDATPQTLIAGVQTLTFSYWDAAGVVIAAPVAAADIPRIRSIQMTITTRPEVAPATWNVGNVRVGMTVGVRLRNF